MAVFQSYSKHHLDSGRLRCIQTIPSNLLDWNIEDKKYASGATKQPVGYFFPSGFDFDCYVLFTSILISRPDLNYNNLDISYYCQIYNTYKYLPSVVMSRHEIVLSLFIEIEKFSKQKVD